MNIHDYERALIDCTYDSDSAHDRLAYVIQQLKTLLYFHKYTEPSNRLAVAMVYGATQDALEDIQRLLGKLSKLCNEEPPTP